MGAAWAAGWLLFGADLLGFQAPAAAPVAPTLASRAPSSNVAWQAAAADADVDRAFVSARAQDKPLLLYWGASWCPPCNQLKATLFNRQDFATLARSFVAVHVDGDRPGAQALGSRFKVGAYPTLVLFSPRGQEITRLPGAADAPQVMAVLQQGLASGRPLKAVLEDALAGRPLPANDWRMLAFYSWETSENQLVAAAELPATLARLAAASEAADADTRTRLRLKALAASVAKGAKPDAALREQVLRVLADPAQSRLHMDVLTGGADDIVRTLDSAGSPGRAQMLAAFEAALVRLQADASLSRADRMGALYARVLLARLALPEDAVQVQLPESLLQDVRLHVARDDREITDGYERMAVVTFGAAVLARAGLWDDSDAVLKSNVPRSLSPYYLMSQLGGNARKLGHNEEALRWYSQAWARSEGPATRTQWGTSYAMALLELAPADTVRIEKTVAQLLAEAARDRGAFQGRSARQLQRLAVKLQPWGEQGPGKQALSRLRAQLAPVCRRLEAPDSDRRACRSLLQPT